MLWIPERKTVWPCGFAAAQCGEAMPYRQRYFLIRRFIVLLVLVFLASCSSVQKQIGIPPGAQVAIDTLTEDIASGKDDKIYQEAADEWRQASTLDQTKEFFKTLRAKLGKMKTRAFHVARGEQSKSGAPLEQTYVVQYKTVFERGEGMETFTVVERNGSWLLARYFVNSDALK